MHIKYFSFINYRVVMAWKAGPVQLLFCIVQILCHRVYSAIALRGGTMSYSTPELDLVRREEM